MYRSMLFITNDGKCTIVLTNKENKRKVEGKVGTNAGGENRTIKMVTNCYCFLFYRDVHVNKTNHDAYGKISAHDLCP